MLFYFLHIISLCLIFLIIRPIRELRKAIIKEKRLLIFDSTYLVINDQNAHVLVVNKKEVNNDILKVKYNASKWFLLTSRGYYEIERYKKTIKFYELKSFSEKQASTVKRLFGSDIQTLVTALSPYLKQDIYFSQISF